MTLCKAFSIFNQRLKLNKGETKMKTKIIFAVRCYPSRTQKILDQLPGTGTAYITELIGNQVDKTARNHIVNLKEGNWTEIFGADEIYRAAKANKDILYKTASLRGIN